MERTSFPSTSYAIVQIINLARDIPDAVGDFDLCFVEFLEPLHLEDDDFWIKPIDMRIAPVHMHIASRSRTAQLSYQQLELMMDLEGAYDPEDSTYLGHLDHLFPDPPDWVAKKELGYIHTVQEQSNGYYMVHVSPVTLHFAGPITRAQFEFDLLERVLPIRQQPKKPHTCRFQRKGGTYA